jgi:hypothetical protein
LEPETPEHKAGVLTIQPLHLVPENDVKVIMYNIFKHPRIYTQGKVVPATVTP